MAETTPAKPAPAKTQDVDVESLSWLGHGIPAALGVASIVAAVSAWQGGLQSTLVISLLVVGAALPGLTWLSLKRNRAGWAFLIALAVVLGIMTLFGAPKIRNLVGIPLAAALVIPAAFAVAAFCLSALGHRYKA